jgi:ABC-type multidrug transport system fused ATPase/permease subunit
MDLIRLYARVLALLGPERKLGWILAGGNLALAVAQFAEPVLFGKVIDTLAGAQSRGQAPFWGDLLFLLGAWAGFGIFSILCGTLVALFADRLSHRRRLAVLTGYFEHVL